MPVVAAAIIGGAATIGGGIVGNQSSAREARHQRDFMYNMDNTKRRRDVRDLKAAGLNPILASGFANSVPAGASAAQQNPAANLGQAVASAVQAKRVKAEIATLESQADKNDADANLANRKAGVIRPVSEINDRLGGLLNHSLPDISTTYNSAKNAFENAGSKSYSAPGEPASRETNKGKKPGDPGWVPFGTKKAF